MMSVDVWMCGECGCVVGVDVGEYGCVVCVFMCGVCGCVVCGMCAYI